MLSTVLHTGDAKGIKANMVSALRWEFQPNGLKSASQQECLIDWFSSQLYESPLIGCHHDKPQG